MISVVKKMLNRITNVKASDTTDADNNNTAGDKIKTLTTNYKLQTTNFLCQESLNQV